jgi:hypothetical protein
MEDWKQHKNVIIDHLLSNYMQTLMEIPVPAKVGVKFAISGCLRFACAAAQKIGVDLKELMDELELEWHAKQWSFGTNSGDSLN